MNNKPQYKIHGDARRTVKRKKFAVKSYLNSFWSCHQMDKDMASFYGSENSLMSDERAQEVYDKAVADLKDIETRLEEPYCN